MKKDKISVIVIICVALVVTGVLQYKRSPETRNIVPYLTELESNLSVFGEGTTNEFYSLNSQLKPGIDKNVIPVDYFIKEQLIIDEFNDEKPLRPILCRNEPTDYTSFYISLTNDMKVYCDACEFGMKKLELSDTIFSVANKSVRTVNNGLRFIHKIKANESLSKLAKRYYNDESKWDRIYQANKNRMPNPHSLKIGQELFIPSITVTSNDDKHRIIKT